MAVLLAILAKTGAPSAPRQPERLHENRTDGKQDW